ncbi:MAG: lysylphosphatidylglycerol synthase domain-containing protein [Alphaproteobacteria bacterium]
MRWLAVLGLAAGLGLTGYLVLRHDPRALLESLLSLGWGAALLPVAYLPHILFDSACLRLVFPPSAAPGLGRSVWGTLIARSINTLLPVGGIGGDVVKVRILAQGGVAVAAAGAGMVVDKTVQTVSLVLWAAIGIGALIWLRADPAVVRAAVSGAGLFALGVAGFVVVQRSGLLAMLARWLGRRIGDRAGGMAGFLAATDTALRDSYRRVGRLCAAVLLMTLSRATLTLEVWIAAHFMGLPLGIAEALMLKSLTGALRGAAFVVPNGLGIQEAGFVLLGGLLGYPPEAMLAISLATRAREIAVSLPVLAGWQIAEGRRLLGRAAPPVAPGAARSAASPATDPER